MKSKYLFSLKNYQAALVAAFLFGCIAPGSKLLVQVLPPQSMAGLLYFFAGIGLFFLLVCKRSLLKSLSEVQRPNYKWFLLATLFGGVLGPAFLVYGLSHLGGATASLLLNLEAVLTSLIAWFIFKEHFERKIVYGMILIVLGCLTLSINAQASGGTDTLFGFVLISFACLSWGIDNNLTRKISHLDPVLIATFKGLIAGSTNLFLGYIIGERLTFGFEIIQVGVLGFFGIGFSLVAFIISLSAIGTARTGAIFSTAPFIGAIFSILFLAEPFTFPFAIALLFMISGVWFHLSENHGHEHSHSALTHSHEHSHDAHHEHSHSPNETISGSHTHVHTHLYICHTHAHFPDIHHQHIH